MSSAIRSSGLKLATFVVALLLPGTVSGRQLVVAPSGGNYTTVAAGISAAQAGDTVRVRSGVYREAVSFGRSGSSSGFITLLGDPGATLDGGGSTGQGVSIHSLNYIRVQGMTVQNFKGSGTPIGISVDGNSSFIEVRNNLVHDIENPTGNAHGIAFYGTGPTPMTNITVDGNEVRNCRLGQSESLVLNGDIDGFVVSRNTIHDNDNIGIDLIGFEGTGPTGQDQARNGTCADNVIYNISSATNPTYYGDRSADGIYVDGGRDIVIERNKVDNCDISVEVACEHGGHTVSNVTVRNNFLSRGYQGNILMGGYDSKRGSDDNVTVVNNTTCQATFGEIQLQYYCNAITIKNNILSATSGQPYLSVTGTGNTNVQVDNNIYTGAGLSPGDLPDALAQFVDPLLVAPYEDLHIRSGSPAIDKGLALGNDAQGQPISGVTDIDGNPRVRGSGIDIGAQEFASTTLGVDGGPGPALRLVAAGTLSRPALELDLPATSAVDVALYDVTGRRVMAREAGVLGAGRHVLPLGDPAIASGVYFGRATITGPAGVRALAARLVLVR